MDRLGWEADADEPDRVRALRGALLQGLGVLGAARTRRRPPASSRPRLARANRRRIARRRGRHRGRDHGYAADYERYWTAYLDSPTPQEQYRYLFALPLSATRP